jgi:hypothetical protein
MTGGRKHASAAERPKLHGVQSIAAEIPGPLVDWTPHNQRQCPQERHDIRQFTPRFLNLLDGSDDATTFAYRSTIEWIPNRVSGRPQRLRKTDSEGERPHTKGTNSLTVLAHNGQRRRLFPSPWIRTEEDSRCGVWAT